MDSEWAEEEQNEPFVPSSGRLSLGEGGDGQPSQADGEAGGGQASLLS